MISIHHLIAAVCLAGFISCGTVGVAKKTVKSDPPVPVTIHATNFTKTPNVHYVVDAVELLKQSYEIYTLDADIANLYIALYGEKYPEYSWNIVTGYTAVIINSDIYVECAVTSGKSKDNMKKDKEADKNILIFSASPTVNPSSSPAPSTPSPSMAP